ncbi:hypothetical protein ACQPZF_35210 [Actinosynnema sp. CS-041913]|uniref:hypothetical protein n=1 Tax=Actinosynnema sp. CS-041913 TaxID=3239917 RepID=UPI003D901EF0
MRLRVLALAVLLTGCATANHSEGRQAPSAAPPPADFPVSASPRPIVLIGPMLEVVDGFRDGDEKLGSASGAFEFAGLLPATPEPAAVTLPDGPTTVTFIGPADALRAMAAQAGGPKATPPGTTPLFTTGPDTAPPNPTPAPPAVKLVAAEFGAAEFPTDRGPWTLPAWRFTTEAGSVVAWPALPPAAFWKPGEVRPAIVSGPATGGGTELTVTMASPPYPCLGDEPARNEPVVAETDTAVTVTLRTIGEVGDCPRTLALMTEPYQVKLAKPLGNRLLVDDQGGVIAVTTR